MKFKHFQIGKRKFDVANSKDDNENKVDNRKSFDAIPFDKLFDDIKSGKIDEIHLKSILKYAKEIVDFLKLEKFDVLKISYAIVILNYYFTGVHEFKDINVESKFPSMEIAKELLDEKDNNALKQLCNVGKIHSELALLLMKLLTSISRISRQMAYEVCHFVNLSSLKNWINICSYKMKYRILQIKVDPYSAYLDLFTTLIFIGGKSVINFLKDKQEYTTSIFKQFEKYSCENQILFLSLIHKHILINNELDKNIKLNYLPFKNILILFNQKNVNTNEDCVKLIEIIFHDYLLLFHENIPVPKYNDISSFIEILIYENITNFEKIKHILIENPQIYFKLIKNISSKTYIINDSYILERLIPYIPLPHSYLRQTTPIDDIKYLLNICIPQKWVVCKLTEILNMNDFACVDKNIHVFICVRYMMCCAYKIAKYVKRAHPLLLNSFISGLYKRLFSLKEILDFSSKILTSTFLSVEQHLLIFEHIIHILYRYSKLYALENYAISNRSIKAVDQNGIIDFVTTIVDVFKHISDSTFLKIAFFLNMFRINLLQDVHIKSKYLILQFYINQYVNSSSLESQMKIYQQFLTIMTPIMKINSDVIIWISYLRKWSNNLSTLADSFVRLLSLLCQKDSQQNKVFSDLKFFDLTSVHNYSLSSFTIIELLGAIVQDDYYRDYFLLETTEYKDKIIPFSYATSCVIFYLTSLHDLGEDIFESICTFITFCCDLIIYDSPYCSMLITNICFVFRLLNSYTSTKSFKTSLNKKKLDKKMHETLKEKISFITKNEWGKMELVLDCGIIYKWKYMVDYSCYKASSISLDDIEFNNGHSTAGNIDVDNLTNILHTFIISSLSDSSYTKNNALIDKINTVCKSLYVDFSSDKYCSDYSLILVAQIVRYRNILACLNSTSIIQIMRKIIKKIPILQPDIILLLHDMMIVKSTFVPPLTDCFDSVVCWKKVIKDFYNCIISSNNQTIILMINENIIKHFEINSAGICDLIDLKESFRFLIKTESCINKCVIIKALTISYFKHSEHNKAFQLFFLYKMLKYKKQLFFEYFINLHICIKSIFIVDDYELHNDMILNIFNTLYDLCPYYPSLFLPQNFKDIVDKFIQNPCNIDIQTIPNSNKWGFYYILFGSKNSYFLDIIVNHNKFEPYYSIFLESLVTFKSLFKSFLPFISQNHCNHNLYFKAIEYIIARNDSTMELLADHMEYASHNQHNNDSFTFILTKLLEKHKILNEFILSKITIFIKQTNLISQNYMNLIFLEIISNLIYRLPILDTGTFYQANYCLMSMAKNNIVIKFKFRLFHCLYIQCTKQQYPMILRTLSKLIIFIKPKRLTKILKLLCGNHFLYLLTVYLDGFIDPTIVNDWIELVYCLFVRIKTTKEEKISKILKKNDLNTLLIFLLSLYEISVKEIDLKILYIYSIISEFGNFQSLVINNSHIPSFNFKLTMNDIFNYTEKNTIPVIHVSEIFTKLNETKIHSSIKNFPLNHKLSVYKNTLSFNEKVDSYDPAFILSLFSKFLSLKNIKTTEIIKFIENEYLAYVITCLSSKDDELRMLSYRTLLLFSNHLERSTFHSKYQIQLLLKFIKNSVNSPFQTQLRFNTFLLGIFSKILLNPAHKLYKYISKIFIHLPFYNSSVLFTDYFINTSYKFVDDEELIAITNLFIKTTKASFSSLHNVKLLYEDGILQYILSSWNVNFTSGNIKKSLRKLLLNLMNHTIYIKYGTKLKLLYLFNQIMLERQAAEDDEFIIQIINSFLENTKIYLDQLKDKYPTTATVVVCINYLVENPVSITKISTISLAYLFNFVFNKIKILHEIWLNKFIVLVDHVCSCKEYMNIYPLCQSLKIYSVFFNSEVSIECIESLLQMYLKYISTVKYDMDKELLQKSIYYVLKKSYSRLKTDIFDTNNGHKIIVTLIRFHINIYSESKCYLSKYHANILHISNDVLGAVVLWILNHEQSNDEDSFISQFPISNMPVSHKNQIKNILSKYDIMELVTKHPLIFHDIVNGNSLGLLTPPI